MADTPTDAELIEAYDATYNRMRTFDRHVHALRAVVEKFTPSPPVAAPPATPSSMTCADWINAALGELDGVETDDENNCLSAARRALTKALAAAQPQPQPAQPLTGVKTRYMTLMGTGARIPFAVLNEEWAQNNHGQSLARLQERGGLCPTEALAIIERRKWRAMDADEALHEVLRRVDRIAAPSTPTHGDQHADR